MRTRPIVSIVFVASVIVGCRSAPAPTIAPGGNPFAGRSVFVDPASPAARQADAWRSERPRDAALMQELAAQPVAMWLGEWSGDVRSAVASRVAEARRTKTLALFVLYNVPNRDCGLYSAGGLEDPERYRRWIGEVKQGIGRGPAVVILEPDALGNLDMCLSPAEQRERLALLAEAVAILGEGGAFVYIDAGNAAWHPPEVMAERLQSAGIARARGFALNVSNYIETEQTVAYGMRISALLDDKSFVIDTSRNGNGATVDLQWCNPAGRAVGESPTTQTADPRVDAYLWIKTPGESDGTCNGGPRAGAWWPEIAIELASRSAWVRAATGTAAPPPDAPAVLPPAPGPGVTHR